jgi:hypothetical protein
MPVSVLQMNVTDRKALDQKLALGMNLSLARDLGLRCEAHDAGGNLTKNVLFLVGQWPMLLKGCNERMGHGLVSLLLRSRTVPLGPYLDLDDPSATRIEDLEQPSCRRWQTAVNIAQHLTAKRDRLRPGRIIVRQLYRLGIRPRGNMEAVHRHRLGYGWRCEAVPVHYRTRGRV